jgi:hypothetical protein
MIIHLEFVMGISAHADPALDAKAVDLALGKKNWAVIASLSTTVLYCTRFEEGILTRIARLNGCLEHWSANNELDEMQEMECRTT